MLNVGKYTSPMDPMGNVSGLGEYFEVLRAPSNVLGTQGLKGSPLKDPNISHSVKWQGGTVPSYSYRFIDVNFNRFMAIVNQPPPLMYPRSKIRV